jgi:DNA-binding MarR family transcriptional regulator
MKHMSSQSEKKSRGHRDSGAGGTGSACANVAFLLSQVGYHSAAMFAQRLEPMKLSPPDAGILKAIDESEGLSQQELGEKLSMFPSRLVIVLDQLEKRNLVERRPRPTDRRSHALHLSPGGREALKTINRVAREHQNALCAGLNDAERKQLECLLRKVASEQGLKPGIHPGLRKLNPQR